MLEEEEEAVLPPGLVRRERGSLKRRAERES